LGISLPKIHSSLEPQILSLSLSSSKGKNTDRSKCSAA
jgi:hypothetical protein